MERSILLLFMPMLMQVQVPFSFSLSFNLDALSHSETPTNPRAVFIEAHCHQAGHLALGVWICASLNAYMPWALC